MGILNSYKIYRNVYDDLTSNTYFIYCTKTNRKSTVGGFGLNSLFKNMESGPYSWFGTDELQFNEDGTKCTYNNIDGSKDYYELFQEELYKEDLREAFPEYFI